jgi:hypothetical protein
MGDVTVRWREAADSLGQAGPPRATLLEPMDDIDISMGEVPLTQLSLLHSLFIAGCSSTSRSWLCWTKSALVSAWKSSTICSSRPRVREHAPSVPRPAPPRRGRRETGKGHRGEQC